MKKTPLLILLALLPALPAAAADAGFTLGIPRAPKIRNTANAAGNAWLASNAVYSAMAIVAPSAEPHGFWCFRMTTPGASNSRTIDQQASVSSRLL